MLGAVSKVSHNRIVVTSTAEVGLSVRTVLIIFIVFFFFQAEDGIRDLIVTGVQTCALPILGYVSDPELLDKARSAARRALALDSQIPESHTALANLDFNYFWNFPEADEEIRSEERRVGKECRSRWSPYH